MSKLPWNFQHGRLTGLITGRLITVLVLGTRWCSTPGRSGGDFVQTHPSLLSTEEKQRTFRPIVGHVLLTERWPADACGSLPSASPLGTFLALVCQWFFPEGCQAIGRTGMGREQLMPELWTVRGGPRRPRSFFSQPLLSYILCSFCLHSF